MVAVATAPHGSFGRPSWDFTERNIVLPGETIRLEIVEGLDYTPFVRDLRMAETARWLDPPQLLRTPMGQPYITHRRGDPITLRWSPLTRGAMIVEVRHSTQMHDTTRVKCYFDARAGSGEISAELVARLPDIVGVPKMLQAYAVDDELVVDLGHGVLASVAAANYVFSSVIEEM
jgi:hypothetical protein